MAAAYPEALARLVDEFQRHPGVGPKSAERLAFFTLTRDATAVRAFAAALENCVARVRPCERCGCLGEGDACPMCDDGRRDDSKLCVVADPKDVFVFERSGVWAGRYHVLGGLVSPLDGVGPEDLRVAGLLERAAEAQVEEVVLALPPSTEGEATSVYLSGALADAGVSVTRIAYGLPVGAELEFADPVTLLRALEGRKAL